MMMPGITILLNDTRKGELNVAICRLVDMNFIRRDKKNKTFCSESTMASATHLR